MDVKQWGPPYWVALHTVAQNYDPSAHDAKQYKRFFRDVGETLPCIHCRRSYKQFMKEIPIEPYLNKPRGLAKWLFLMHNRINKKLRDQGEHVPPDPSFEEVYDKYEQYRANCSKQKTCRTKSSVKQTGGSRVVRGARDSRHRCTGTTSAGSRCIRMVDGSNRCFQHRS